MSRGRKRDLSTDISINEELAELSSEGLLPLLLYTWAIPHTSDAGTLTGEPRKFKMLVCPGLDVSTAEVEKALQRLADVKQWSREGEAGKRVIQFPLESFYKYQSYIPLKDRASLPAQSKNGSHSHSAENSGKHQETPEIAGDQHTETGISREQRETAEDNGDRQGTPENAGKCQDQQVSPENSSPLTLMPSLTQTLTTAAPPPNGSPSPGAEHTPLLPPFEEDVGSEEVACPDDYAGDDHVLPGTDAPDEEAELIALLGKQKMSEPDARRLIACRSPDFIRDWCAAWPDRRKLLTVTHPDRYLFKLIMEGADLPEEYIAAKEERARKERDVEQRKAQSAIDAEKEAMCKLRRRAAEKLFGHLKPADQKELRNEIIWDMTSKLQPSHRSRMVDLLNRPGSGAHARYLVLLEEKLSARFPDRMTAMIAKAEREGADDG